MSLTKVNYIDNSTIITAKNLNDIQDNIIELNNSTIITAENLNDIQDNIIKLNNNSISKNNIINNFTTTEEGFVADARALKTLNDSKLSMELLWENASPASKFGEQYIPFGKTGSGLYMLVYTGVNNQRTFCEFLKKGLFTLYFKGFPSGNEYYRNGTVFDENIYFIDARNWTTADYQGSVSNNALIPVQLYEIKGVSQ